MGGGVPINSNAKWRDRTKADVYLRGRGVLAHPINLGQIVTRESVAQVVPALDLVLHPLRLPRARMQTLALGRRTVSKQSSVRRVPAAAANVVALRENRTRAPKKTFSRRLLPLATIEFSMSRARLGKTLSRFHF